MPHLDVSSPLQRLPAVPVVPVVACRSNLLRPSKRPSTSAESCWAKLRYPVKNDSSTVRNWGAKKASKEFCNHHLRGIEITRFPSDLRQIMISNSETSWFSSCVKLYLFNPGLTCFGSQKFTNLLVAFHARKTMKKLDGVTHITRICGRICGHQLLHVGVSENSVPLNPMVNDHYPH